MLPSIKVTFQRLFTLYKETFIDVLPFLLLVAVLQIGLNKILPIDETAQLGQILAHLVVNSIVTSLLFCFVLYGIYTKHYQQRFNYVEVVKKGISRVIPLILAGLIIISPLILMVGIVSLARASENIFMVVYLLATAFAFFYALVILIYCYFVGIFVVCKDMNPWEGIKQSRNVVHNRWAYIFVRIFLLLVIVTTVSFLLSYYLNLTVAEAIITVLTFSLGPCMMVILHEILENAKA